MRIYLSESQIPELASIDPSQRRLLNAEAMKEIRKKNRWFGYLPVMLCVVGGILGYSVSMFFALTFQSAGGFSKVAVASLICALVGAGGGGFLGGIIGRQFMIHRFRLYWREKLANCSDQL